MTQERQHYYDVSNLSTQIESIEYASNKVNVIARVEYDTIIKASTPEDSPYIQGIEGAIEDLTDEAQISEATDYLEMWKNELNRNHINKTISNEATFNIAFSIQPSLINAKQSVSVDQLLANSSIMYRDYNFITNDNVTTLNNGIADTEQEFTDKPIDAFELETDSEVYEKAYNTVIRLVNNGTKASGSSRAQELDRVAARDYAQDPANFPRNPDYNYYTSEDCANFVSQCYYEGGLSEDNIWKRYTIPWINTGGSRSTYYGLSDYMQEYDIVFWVKGDTDIDRAIAGSIIYYQSGTPEGHVGIVTSNDGRTMKYSAHTNDHCDETMNQEWFSENCDFLIPCWDSYDNRWTPQ